MLQNRIYVGDIVHKGKSYPGEHEGIIDPDLFDKVQTIITANRMKKLSSVGTKHPCLLAGKLFDDRGNYMTPKHSNTRKRHYRYYTSQAIIQGHAYKAGSLPNIPAHEIEQLVRSEISAFLKDSKQLQPHLQSESLDQQKRLMQTACNLTHDTSDQERLFLRSIIHRIELSNTQVKIKLCADHLVKALQGVLTNETPPEMENPIILTRNVKLAATVNGSKVIVGSAAPGQNIQLVKAIARSFLWNEQLLSGDKATVKEISKQENIASSTYVSRVIRLRFLAPDIIQSILEGAQPVEWTVEKLFAIKSLDWQEQRQILGIA